MEALRPSFPELEHFSFILRELHDSGAVALTLHTRTLVSRLGGLRLVDIRHRYTSTKTRATAIVVLLSPPMLIDGDL